MTEYAGRLPSHQAINEARRRIGDDRQIELILTVAAEIDAKRAAWDFDLKVRAAPVHRTASNTCRSR